MSLPPAGKINPSNRPLRRFGRHFTNNRRPVIPASVCAADNKGIFSNFEGKQKTPRILVWRMRDKSQFGGKIYKNKKTLRYPRAKKSGSGI